MFLAMVEIAKANLPDRSVQGLLNHRAGERAIAEYLSLRSQLVECPEERDELLADHASHWDDGAWIDVACDVLAAINEPKAHDQLVQLLASRHYAPRHALIRLGSDAVGSLIGGLTHPDPLVARTCAWRLCCLNQDLVRNHARPYLADAAWARCIDPVARGLIEAFVAGPENATTPG